MGLIQLFSVLDGWDVDNFPDQASVNPAQTLASLDHCRRERRWNDARQILQDEIQRLAPVLRLSTMGAISDVLNAGPSGFDVNRYMSHLHTELGRCWLVDSKWEEARSSLLRALAAFPSDTEAPWVFVDLYTAMGDYTAAIEQLAAVTQNRPEGYVAMFDLGLAIEAKNVVADAQECFKRVASLDPAGLFAELAGIRLAHLNEPSSVPQEQDLDEGLAELQHDLVNDALARFLRVLAWYPQHPGTWFMVGYIHQQKLASSVVRLGTDVRDPVFLASDRLGSTLTHMGLAAQAYRMAIRYGPAIAEAHHQLANCYLALDLPAQALPQAMAAIEMEPTNPGFLADLGSIYLANNQLHEAEAVLQTALRYDPHDPLAHRTLYRVLTRLGRQSDPALYSAPPRQL